jgi:radical SAM superfamily enzyme YgiQ (UPF0313 family)
MHGVILTDVASKYGIKPLGAYSISNILRKNGYDILVINLYSKLEKWQLVNLLNKFITSETLFFGYSSSFFSTWDINKIDYTWLLTSVDYFQEINALAKTLNPTIKIIFGGSASHQFMNHAKEEKTTSGVDYVMHGYSEAMILDFANSLKSHKKPKFSRKTAGIYEIDYDIKGLSHDYHGTSFAWHQSDYVVENESLPIEIARGCIFKCKFCAFPLLGKNKNDLSYTKKEDLLLEEVIKNYEHSKSLNYFIVDDTFNERVDKIEMLLRVRDKSKLDLSFSGYTRLDLIHRFPEQIPLLHDLNFKGFIMGIESMNHLSAKSVGKGLLPELQINTLDKIVSHYKNNVSITGLFIIGLPHETPDTFKKWADWVISENSPFDYVVFTPLIIGQEKTTHTESEFFKNFAQYGYTLSNDNKLWTNKHWSFIECGKLALSYMEKIEKSGKQKISNVAALGLTKYGYDYSNTLKRPLNSLFDINTSRYTARNIINDELESKFSDHISNYYNMLMSI